jgi:hypothetical protein
VKEKITAFIHTLSMYDYILFGSAVFLFFFFIIVAILLRNRLGIALTFVILGFASLMLGPTVGYMELHKYLYKHSLTLLSYKKLHFTNAVVIYANLKNESKLDFKECVIKAQAYKVTKNKYKNYIYKLKPFQKMSIVQADIKKGESREIKMLMEPFSYARDFNISLGADCR